MKVMVTGGCGFIGSHVCEFYAARGDDVVAFDNLTKHELARTGYATEAIRRFNVDFLRRLGVEIRIQDLRDRAAVLEAARDASFIVHTGAQPAMTIGVEDPVRDFETNAAGTFNVLEAARRFGIPVVICSTIHVYGNGINDSIREAGTRYTRQPPTIDETHPVGTGTMTPLHASKRTGELYVQTYIDTYGVRAAAFRLTGLYGPRQFGGEDHGWLANFAIRAVIGAPITIFGSGRQTRDVLFASDVTEAFDAFYRTQQPGIYTIGGGPDHAISLLESIDLLGDLVGRRPDVVFEPERPGDLRYFVCDTTRASRDLGWAPRVGVRHGVGRLVQWVQTHVGMFTSESITT
jgi:CDP-paratose 2-epimerase